MHLIHLNNIILLITTAIYSIKAGESQEGSPKRSSSSDFNWESMIDWKYSPEHDTSHPSTAIPKSPKKTAQKSVKKYVSNKERYSAEELKKKNRRYYLNVRSDPKKVQRIRERSRELYHIKQAEQKERLAKLPEAEREIENAKREAKLEKKRALYQSKYKPKKKEFKTSEEVRRKGRKKQAKFQLRKMLKDQKGLP